MNTSMKRTQKHEENKKLSPHHRFLVLLHAGGVGKPFELYLHLKKEADRIFVPVV